MTHDFTSLIPRGMWDLPLSLHGSHKHDQNIPLALEIDVYKHDKIFGPIIRNINTTVYFNGPVAPRGWEIKDVWFCCDWIEALWDFLVEVDGFDTYETFTQWGYSPQELCQLNIASVAESERLQALEMVLLMFYTHSMYAILRQFPTLFYPSATAYLICPCCWSP